jgi:hypothetical protein
MNRVQSERGVALGMVVLVTLVLAVMLAAGFAGMSSERRVIANDEASSDAFLLAQNGLELFIAKRDSFGFMASPPAASESTRATFGGGYVDVVLQQVRSDTVNHRYGYVIRAHAVRTDPALSGTPPGERTVAEYAAWQIGTMHVLSGWTSLTGLQLNSTSATLTGNDGCNMMAPVAGVAVPTSPGYVGPATAVTGNPPVLYLGTQQQAVQATHLDWNGIVNQHALRFDYVIPPASWTSINFTNWPIIEVVGDFTLPDVDRHGQPDDQWQQHVARRHSRRRQPHLEWEQHGRRRRRERLERAVRSDPAHRVGRQRDQDLPVQLVQRDERHDQAREARAVHRRLGR